MFFVPTILNKLWQYTGLLPISLKVMRRMNQSTPQFGGAVHPQVKRDSTSHRQVRDRRTRLESPENPEPLSLQWDFKLYLLSATLLGVLVVLALKDVRHFYRVWRNEDIRQFCANNSYGVYLFRYRSSTLPTSMTCSTLEDITFMDILNYLLLTIMVSLGVTELNVNYQSQIRLHRTVENFDAYYRRVSTD